MAILRKYWLTVLCLSTTVMFFAQVMLCASDEAGLISCAQTTGQDDGSSSAKSGKMPIVHSCHCISHTSLFLPGSESISNGDVVAVTYFDRSSFAPEGLAREIDYPPQLS